MNRTAAAFVLIAIMTILLMLLGYGLQMKGYAFGALGNDRLNGLASPSTFIPLAAIYAFGAALVMILPLRLAGSIHGNALGPVHATALVLMATIVGVRVARFALSDSDALWALLDWRFIFAAAIVAAHGMLDALRKNLLLRTLSFLGFVIAMLVCLYWTFRF